MKPAEISFVVARCTSIPAGSIVVYRWPGKDRFNVLGATVPTKEQALAAISEFLKKEQEHKAKQEAAP